MRFASLLKNARKAAGLTQVALGARLGISGPTVTGWESGDRLPTDARLYAIAQALDIDEPTLAAWRKAKWLDSTEPTKTGSAA